MKHIFVSHSRRDRNYLKFLSTAFATSGVAAKYEEYEDIVERGSIGRRVAEDIRSAEAIFVLLTGNVERLSVTRDWISWECGVGHDKEVWVFEPANGRANISVVIPRVDHYVAFDVNNNWVRYLAGLLSFMKKRKAKALAVSGGSAAGVVGGLGLLGSLAGISFLALPPVLPIIALWAAGMYLMKRDEGPANDRPLIKSQGFECDGCGTRYTLHREDKSKIRCPICNMRHVFMS